MSPSPQPQKRPPSSPRDKSQDGPGNAPSTLPDEATDRCVQMCRKMEQELLAAMRNTGRKEEAILCQLAVETNQLALRLSLFRELVRSSQPPPKAGPGRLPRVVL